MTSPQIWAVQKPEVVQQLAAALVRPQEEIERLVANTLPSAFLNDVGAIDQEKVTLFADRNRRGDASAIATKRAEIRDRILGVKK